MKFISLVLTIPVLAASTSGAQEPAIPRDSATIVHDLRAAVRDFAGLWSYAWRDTTSILARRGPERMWIPGEAANLGALVHCHPDGEGSYRRLEPFVVDVPGTRFARCPSWVVLQRDVPVDERNDIDVGLAPKLRTAMRRTRAALLVDLDRESKNLPGDDWIVGQRVRLALEQLDTTRARVAARDCRAQRWWCDALRGYVEYGQGNVALADSFFIKAMAVAPDLYYCGWTNLAVLFDAGTRYGKLPCAARDSINRVVWWLADPLYLEEGNERRAEHFSRLVLATLHADIRELPCNPTVPMQCAVFDGRYEWDVKHGGGAVLEMIERYGWPSYAHWGHEDQSHLGYLRDSGPSVFTTNEYTPPRFHTVPAWRAVERPFQAVDTDWDLWPERAPADLTPRNWWPREHYARTTGPIFQLRRYQIAMFRRDDRGQIALAVGVESPDLALPRSVSLRGSLFLGPDAESMRSSPVRADVGKHTVVHAGADAGPQLLSLEMMGDGPTPVAARLRFGIVAPQSLSALAANALAISDIALLEPETDRGLIAPDPAAALERMATSTTVVGNRLGLYWETYGASAGDTVSIAIRIEAPASRPGFVGRVLDAVGLVNPVSPAVTIQWREPDASHKVMSIGGRVPIVARTLSLDISQLAPGTYRLSIAVSKPGGSPVIALREFVLKSPSS